MTKQSIEVTREWTEWMQKGNRGSVTYTSYENNVAFKPRTKRLLK